MHLPICLILYIIILSFRHLWLSLHSRGGDDDNNCDGRSWSTVTTTCRSDIIILLLLLPYRPNYETKQSDGVFLIALTTLPIAKRCRRRYHGDETAVAVTTRSSLGRMIVRDPNVVGFVRGLLPPPPPLPALLPRWSLPRQSGGSACLVSAGGGGRITLYMYFFRSVFVIFFNPSTAPSSHDRGR